MGSVLPRLAPLLALILTTGCSESRNTRPTLDAAATGAMAPTGELQRAAGAPAPQSAAPALAAQMAARKLIRTAQMSIETADYSASVSQAEALVEQLGGYVADSQITRGAHNRRHGTLTLRVPADQFKAALAGVRGLGQVLSENVTVQDVTKAYTDVETRLRVKRDTAARLHEILRGKTARLSDVLEVERELARVTEESEALEGERRFYDQQLALSSIALNLSEPDAVVSASAVEPTASALHNSLRVLSISIAALIAVVVFVVPWALVAWLAWRVIAWLRARRRPRSAPAA